jgi:hypothetical protein
VVSFASRFSSKLATALDGSRCDGARQPFYKRRERHTVIVSSRIHARDVPTGVNALGSKLAIKGSGLAETVMAKRPTRLAGKV